MKRSILLLGTAIVAACASSPASTGRWAGQPVEFFTKTANAPDEWATRGVAGVAPSGDWLSQFNDPLMVGLVNEALTNSPTLESRAALVRASEASTRVARAQRRPSVSASASAGVNTDGIYGIGLDASWELDLWNRLGSGIGAAEADYAASQADFAAAELSIAAQTAIAWINLNEALAQERVAVLTFEARDRVRTLTERRFQRGLADALDVRTARSTVAQAEASIAARRQITGETARRLETLVGRYPSAELGAPAEIPTLDVIVPEGNPALLLSRRPDIAGAEARIAAAGLRAEQARLAMLPSLRLTASASTSTTEFSDAFDPEKIAANLIASLVQPLFTGGSLDAQRDAAVAQAEAAVANYAAAALDAWREVENALAADILLAKQEEAQVRAVEEASLAEELAERQYTSGTVTIFNLIDSQTRRLTAESQLVSARASRASNRVAYHLALGGGLPSGTSGAQYGTNNIDTDAAASGRS
jgi:NodT family efflux transporter outer membrane factor (OMF) lipoprotein